MQQQLATAPVPHTAGVTYGQLRHVRRSGAALQPGTLLAGRMNWQRKAVVTSVVNHPDGTATVELVLVANVCAFNGYIKPATRARPRQVQAELYKGQLWLGWWVPVQPFNPAG